MPKKIQGGGSIAQPIIDAIAAEQKAEKLSPSAPESQGPLSSTNNRPSLLPLTSAGKSWLGVQSGSAITVGTWDIIPGRYPDVIGINDVLASAASDQERAQMIKGLVAHVEGLTGMKVPDATMAAIMKKPALVTDAFRATSKEMSQGLQLVQKLIAEGTIQDFKEKASLLGPGFNFADYAQTNIETPNSEPKEIAPKIYFGSLPGDLKPEQAKSNIVTAEIFDRLSQNSSEKTGRFSVTYGGKRRTRVDTFLKELQKNGHIIEAKVQHRVANFTDLKTKGPDGKFYDIPFGIGTRSLVTNSKGEEAEVPTVHSELVFSIRPGPKTKDTPDAPAITADIKFYQGVSGMGFFPVGLSKQPAWLGLAEAPEKLTGAKAADAIRLAGLFTDVVETTSKKQGLGIWGYGVTGVCNDSVAVIQHAVTGKTTCHPLLMIDESIEPELLTRVASGYHRDRSGYARLLASVKALPNDFELRPDTKTRARDSFPYRDLPAPTRGTEKAFEILFP